jgi:GAF domain-containing protein
VPPTKGVAGYVFSTGEAIALADVASDPRFDRATAERTGYVPRSIAAVPLSEGSATLGVLQVLDRQGSATFSLADMTRLGVFAGQATASLRATRLGRDTERLLRTFLARAPSPGAPDAEVDGGWAAAIAALDREDEAPFWVLVRQLVALRQLPDRELALVADLLEVMARSQVPGGRYRQGTPGRRWGR